MSGKEKGDLESGNKLFLSLQFLTEKADPEARIFPWSMPAKMYQKAETTLIYGTALVAGRTRKGDFFGCEELVRRGCTLIGGPIEVFEHSWDVGESRWLPFPDNVIVDAEEVDKRLEYIARVAHPKVQQLIHDGTLNQVSVNAICRHVPRDDPGKCEGMILNGFCLLHKDSIPASEGTCVKVWNCDRMSEKPKTEGNQEGKPETQGAKTGQLGVGPVAGEIQPSIEDRVKTLESQFENFDHWASQQFAVINGKLDTLIVVTQKMPSPIPAPGPAQITPPPESPTQKTQADTQAEKDKQAQQARAGKYGITVKDGGNVTKPGDYANVPDDEFADPVNYRYPVDKSHVGAALTYFNQQKNREAGGYSVAEQVKVMEKIIDAAVANGVEVAWQGEDPVYQGLSETCKSKLKGYQTQKTEEVTEGMKKTAGNVVANLKPVGNEPAQEHAVVLTEAEIYGVLQNKRFFTSALQVNGILDLLDQKKKEAD